MISTSNIISALKELHYVNMGLSESDSAKYRLICRYEGKVSRRLRKERDALYEKGKDSFGMQLRDMLMKPNPLLDLIKRPSFGAYTAVPITFGGSK